MGRVGAEQIGRWFDEHASALVLYARQWSDTPEDIVQEAFLQLARQKSAPDRVVSWLYRVVRNAAIADLRSDRRRKRREEKAANGEAWFASTDDELDAQAASALLAELDGETREVIVARLWGGLTFEEIARLQGCSLTTAHRRYHAGLAMLQERLDGSCLPLKPAPKTTKS